MTAVRSKVIHAIVIIFLFTFSLLDNLALMATKKGDAHSLSWQLID